MKRKKVIVVALIMAIGIACVYLANRESSDQGGSKVQVQVAKESSEAELDVENTNEKKVAEESSKDDSCKANTELHLDTYEELKKDKDVMNQKSTKADEESKSGSAITEEVQINNSKVVIDESNETMKDKTAGAEKEYVASEEPSKRIELHEPKVTEGKDVTVDTKPGGKRNIGTWG